MRKKVMFSDSRFSEGWGVVLEDSFPSGDSVRLRIKS